MTTQKQRLRPPFIRKARIALAVLLAAAAAALAACGDGTEAGERSAQTMAQTAAVCSEAVRDALEEAYTRSEPVPTRRDAERSEPVVKSALPEGPERGKSYAPRQTPYGVEGTAGRLVIPSVGINVAVYLPGEDAQATCDEEDSACWMEFRSDLNGVIGDHVNQEFSELFYVRPGDACSIFKRGREYRYVCVSTGYGSNIETDVLDAEGNSLFDCGRDRLCMYTCANGWRYVFYAQWQTDGTPPLHQYEAGAQTLLFLMDEDEG